MLVPRSLCLAMRSTVTGVNYSGKKFELPGSGIFKILCFHHNSENHIIKMSN